MRHACIDGKDADETYDRYFIFVARDYFKKSWNETEPLMKRNSVVVSDVALTSYLCEIQYKRNENEKALLLVKNSHLRSWLK